MKEEKIQASSIDTVALPANITAEIICKVIQNKARHSTFPSGQV